MQATGGIPVIYYWAAREAAFYMLYAYAKNEQDIAQLGARSPRSRWSRPCGAA